MARFKSEITPEQRLWELVDKSDGCWTWRGYKTAGYGVFNHGGKRYRVHRLSVELSSGEIPPGMFVDHICRNRACVRPDHLRVVSPRINVLENSISFVAANAAKTHCKRGHPFIPENLMGGKTGKRERICKICSRKLQNTPKWKEYARVYREKNKEKLREGMKRYYAVNGERINKERKEKYHYERQLRSQKKEGNYEKNKYEH